MGIDANPQEDEHGVKSVLPRSRRLIAVGLWGLLTSATAYLFLFEPGGNGFFPPCLFRTLTGFACPACGTTRALHQLVHGNLTTAFELNPLTLSLLPLLAVALFVYSWCAFSSRPLPRIEIPGKYVWSFLVLVIAFWVIRNTAVYPFPS